MSEDPNRLDDLAPESGKAPRNGGVHYPDAYAWLVLVATLDIFCTTLILALGGAEVNPLANLILGKAGLPGMVVFKYIAVATVICICEFIARHRPDIGQRLSRIAVVISAIPVAVALIQLFAVFYAG